MTRRTVAWTWVVVLLAGAGLAASNVRITPVVADGKLLANFSAPSVYSGDVHEAVQSGIAVTITFTAELRRASTLWFDPTLASAEVSSTVKFDTLTGAYQVSKIRAGAVQWVQQTQKEEDMRLWMTEFERVALDDVSVMDAQGDYYIRVRAKDNLPRRFSLWPFGRAEVSGRVEVAAGR